MQSSCIRKSLKKAVFFGFGGSEYAEITAGVDVQVDSQPSTVAATSPVNYQSSVQVGPVAVQTATAVKPRAVFGDKKKPEVFQSELNDGKVLAGFMVPRPAESQRKNGSGLHPELQRYKSRLVKNGVEEEIAQQILNAANREIVENGYPRAGTVGQVVLRHIASYYQGVRAN